MPLKSDCEESINLVAVNMARTIAAIAKIAAKVPPGEAPSKFLSEPELQQLEGVSLDLKLELTSLLKRCIV